MQVKDIMTTPLSIDKSERLGQALDLMEKYDTRRLVVTNNGKLGGIITMRQIARVLGTRRSLGLPASSLHVAAATLDAIITVLPEMEVEDAALLLQKTSVLVVMKGEEILGWVRPREVLATVKLAGAARDAMRGALTVNPHERLIHARRMMMDRDLGRLPVVEGGKLVGIITERDIAKSLRAFRDLVSWRQQDARIKNLLVSDVMTQDVQSVYGDTPLEEVRAIILNENRGGLPVLNQDGQPVGMITRRCLIDYLVRTR
ncbi:MAG: CBS domain-containing protein [Methanosarcinales archaeon]|nr:CBS domain-containing protein [Methanosarcinales archaeon]